VPRAFVNDDFICAATSDGTWRLKKSSDQIDETSPMPKHGHLLYQLSYGLSTGGIRTRDPEIKSL